jgi:hypothetical protein
MRLVVDEEQDPEAWDARVMSLGGTVFHSYAWAQFRCHDGRGRPLFFRWLADGTSEPAAIALGVERRPPGRSAALLGSRLALDSPPAAATADGDVVGSLREWARESGSIAEVQLGSYDARAPWLGGDLTNRVERLEFHLPPRTGPDALRQMRKGARHSIRKATEAGVTARTMNEPPHLLTFGDLYATTLRRLERTKGLEHRSLDPVRFANALEPLVSQGRGRLYGATLNGEMIAGCFFGMFGDSVFYLYSGNSAQGLQNGAVPLLILTATQDFGAGGVSRINLGGVGLEAADPQSSEHGLYEFKLGMGAEPVRCTSAVLPVRPARARLGHFAARARRGYGRLRARRR